jgi:hypothetical protein
MKEWIPAFAGTTGGGTGILPVVPVDPPVRGNRP